jgi:methionyl aminopeptidase
MPKKLNIQNMEEACRIVSDTLLHIKKYITPGISTLELDAIAEDFILTNNAMPAFKGYEVDTKTYPYTLCISIDEEVVHGMPSKRILKEGEVVSIDCGCKINEHYGDSAFTFPVGNISEEKKKLLSVTKESLYKGIEQAKTNNKIYDISRAIQNHVEKAGFSVVRELVGHGIGHHLHEEPAIPNFVPALLHRNKFPNIKLQKGQALAIEPMVNSGGFHVRTANDGWTIYTADKRPSAHFEHTVIIDDNKPVILTYFE